MHRRNELDAAFSWYSSTESDIYSKARDKVSKKKKDFDKLSDDEKERLIEIEVNRLWPLYFREKLSDDSVSSEISEEEYFAGIEAIREKMRKNKEKI